MPYHLGTVPHIFHHVPLPDSFKQPLPGPHEPVDKDEFLSVTITVTPEAPDSVYDQLHDFGTAYGLHSHIRKECRSVRFLGTAKEMQDSFKSELFHVKHGGHEIRARQGHIKIPQAIEPHIVAVMGLDDRPIASPYFRQAKPKPMLEEVKDAIRQFSSRAAERKPKPLTAIEVANAYKNVPGATGKGVTIALIELGGGYTESDLDDYFHGLGMKKPRVEAVPVLGAKNHPGDDADGEVLLDIEVAAAAAPDAEIAVYFAPNTDQGFLEAVLEVATDERKPKLLSISWGSPERYWTKQALAAMNLAFEQCAAAGITVTVASGDNGASDGIAGLNCDYPASSPFVTGCGGTRLILDESGEIIAETVWNDEGAGGGGVSAMFPVPEYQKLCNVPTTKSGFSGRGVPDISGNADPESGYLVVVHGQHAAIGGTSAVAPLVAGMLARIIELRGGKPIGFLNPILYAHPEVCRDIVTGDNMGYAASKCWDACSGLGTVLGTELAKVLGGNVECAKVLEIENDR